MLFSTVIFLSAFLPACIATWFLFGRRNVILLFWSLLFYFSGEGWYIFILLASATIAYLHGELLIRSGGKHKRTLLFLAVSIQILILGYFKYSAFIVEDVAQLTDTGILWPALPLGVSFFVFQAISYSMDVNKDPSTASRNPITVLTYIALFPQLIAGPIVRYSTVARALRQRSVRLRNLTDGAFLLIVGLAQKVLIADKLAIPADNMFGADPASLSSLAAWLGALAYTGQIYFDFAGYSNMALGLGFIFGLKFPRNFNFPYVALSITTFWRRWHISLTRWFRDYVYIPLGGNRKGAITTYRNLILVFLLSGIWHGAAWTFVLWGAYHGVFLVIERLGWGKVLKRIPSPMAWLYAFIAVVVGWVLFRADSVGQFVEMTKRMFWVHEGDDAIIFQSFSLDTWIAALLAIALSTGLFAGKAFRKVQAVRAGAIPLGRIIIGIFAALLFLLCYVEVSASTYSPFIYFRF